MTGRSAPSSITVTPRPVYVIYGTESYLKSEAIERVLKEFLGVDCDHPAYSVFDSDAELADVFDELRTLPLFAEHRVVAVHDADDFISRHRESLENYLNQPCLSATLILVCEHFDARTRLFKLAKEKGELLACEPLKGMAVLSWISRQAQSAHGKTIDRSAATLLQNLVGNELAILASELLKLATYVGQRRQISAEDVEKLVGMHREQKVFGITDAIAQGQTERALTLWEQVWNTDKAAPGRAIGGLAWGVRRLVEAKHNLMEGNNLYAFAKQLWLEPGELKSRLDRFGIGQWEAMLTQLLRVDMNVKTGLHDVLRGIEKYIIQQCITAQMAMK